jgi:ketosteroid isomerase-like protein
VIDDDAAWLAMWNEPDLEAVRAISADDLEVTAVTAAIEPRHYTGRDAAVRWLQELRERLDAGWVATKVTALADDVAVTEGELKFFDETATGAERQTFAILMRFRGDKLRWIGTFVTMGAAREAWKRGIGAEEP